MLRKFIGDGINSDIKNSTCNNVLNIIRALVEDKDSQVYIPNDYKNGSLYSSNSDPRVHFYPSDCGKRIQVVGMQSNQERYNFSVVALVDVLVEQDEEDCSVSMQERKVWRQFNIIRDGKLCMDYICAVLSEENFEALKKIGVLYYNGVEVKSNHNYKSNYVYKIMLKDLPLISYNWANPISIGLYDYMVRENQLSIMIKTLKEYKKNNEAELLRRSVVTSNSDNSVYNEQYSGSSKTDKEMTAVECVTYSLKNIPDFSFEISKKYDSIDDINNEISELNKELRNVRFIIRCVVYAVETAKNQKSFCWSDPIVSTRSKKIKNEAVVTLQDGSSVTFVREVYEKKV